MEKSNAEECFFGSVTVGERGQVVIPSEVRRQLAIEPGDHLLVFRHPMAQGIVLSRLESVTEVIESFQRVLKSIETQPEEG